MQSKLSSFSQIVVVDHFLQISRIIFPDDFCKLLVWIIYSNFANCRPRQHLESYQGGSLITNCFFPWKLCGNVYKVYQLGRHLGFCYLAWFCFLNFFCSMVFQIVFLLCKLTFKTTKQFFCFFCLNNLEKVWNWIWQIGPLSLGGVGGSQGVFWVRNQNAQNPH